VTLSQKHVHHEAEIEFEENIQTNGKVKVEKASASFTSISSSSSAVNVNMSVNTDVNQEENEDEIQATEVSISESSQQNKNLQAEMEFEPDSKNNTSIPTPQEEQGVQERRGNENEKEESQDSNVGIKIEQEKRSVDQKQNSSKVRALIVKKSDSDRTNGIRSCCFGMFLCFADMKAADDDSSVVAVTSSKSLGPESSSHSHLSEYGLELGSERDLFNSSLKFRVLSANEKKLLQYVHESDKDSVKALLYLGVESDFARDDSAKVSVNCFGEDGWTPLHIACSKNDVEMLDLLLQYKADIRAREHGWGLSPLAVAARDGSAECVKFLLENYVRKPDSFVDRYGFSALARAAHTGKNNTCKVLLDAGADPLRRDTTGFTPLHRAAAGGHTKVCELITAYIDVKKKVEEYLTSRIPSGPFDWDNQDDWETNPDPSCVDIRCACIIFVCKGALIDTPIHLAASHGRADVIAALCKSDDEKSDDNSSKKTKIFSANCRGLTGSPPIHGAIRNGSLSCVETLLQVGANPNISDTDGNTSLHVAVAYERGNICKLLIRNGANFELANAIGHTPWELALQLNKFDIMTLLETSMRPDVALRRRQIRAAKMDPKSLRGKLINVQGMGIGKVEGTYKRFPFIFQPKRFRISFLKNDRLNDVRSKKKDIMLEQYDDEDGFSDGTPFFLVNEDLSGSNRNQQGNGKGCSIAST